MARESRFRGAARLHALRALAQVIEMASIRPTPSDMRVGAALVAAGGDIVATSCALGTLPVDILPAIVRLATGGVRP